MKQLTKTCNKCKKELDATTDNFHKSSNCKYGLATLCKECRNANTRRREYNLKCEVISHYGGKCECCEESNITFLTIDHRNGGGCEHRREIGYKIYHWLKKQNFPSGYRVLCCNCNQANWILGYCPHKLEVETLV